MVQAMMNPATQLSEKFDSNKTAFLTNDQRAEFKQNGFLIIEDALSKTEVKEYSNFLDHLDETIDQVTVNNRNERTRKKGDILELRNAAAYHRKIQDLMVHPNAFPLIADLMGPHISLVTSHVFIRPHTPKEKFNKDYKQIDWHRDGPCPKSEECNGGLPWLYTKIGYFLTDLTIENAGALQVIPGSHRYAGAAPQSKDQKEPYGSIQVKVKAGTAVIFDNRIYHSVGPNYSNTSRKNIYFGYGWRYLRPIDDLRPWEMDLSACSPIQKQLLGHKSSELGYYLPTEEDAPLAHWQKDRKEPIHTTL